NNPSKIITLPARSDAIPNGGRMVPGETVGKVTSTSEPKDDRVPGKGDRLLGKEELQAKSDRTFGKGDHFGKGDPGPSRLADQAPTPRRQSRIDTRDTGMRKLNPSPMRGPRQMGFMPGRMGSGGMRGGGFGSHFAMGSGGHGGFGRR